MSFPAKFATECAACDSPIKVGDMIAHHHGGWSHDECPEPKKELHPVCQKCWLTHPEGDCP